MVYLYLPGYSPENQDEMQSNTAVLTQARLKVIQHPYAHWQNPNAAWNVDAEVAKAVQELGIRGTEPVGIIAKSIGTHVAMKLLAKVQGRIRKVVLMGIPVNDLDHSEQSAYTILSRQTIPVTVIQNAHDPHGSSNQITALLQNVDCDLIVKESSDHLYYYPQDILQSLVSKAK